MSNKNTLQDLADLIEPVTESGCWIWTGYLGRNGYARFRYDGKYRNVHRFLYEMSIGKFPDGMVSDHLCRVRCCVNPHHIEPVPNRVNVLRGAGVTSSNATATHCIHGHEFSLENTRTYIGSGGFIYRACRLCHRIRQAAYKKRKRAQSWRTRQGKT